LLLMFKIFFNKIKYTVGLSRLGARYCNDCCESLENGVTGTNGLVRKVYII